MPDCRVYPVDDAALYFLSNKYSTSLYVNYSEKAFLRDRFFQSF